MDPRHLKKKKQAAGKEVRWKKKEQKQVQRSVPELQLFWKLLQCAL